MRVLGVKYTQISIISDWGQWSGFGACTVTCGSGLRTRIRSCLNGQCEGPATDSQLCNAGQCPSRF